SYSNSFEYFAVVLRVIGILKLHFDIIIAAYVASVLSILENYVAEDMEINEKGLDDILNTLSRMFAS
ncbi:hypothetical protein ACQ1Y8_14920, partial [Enterococcus faecalis]|uniref:hypothetical protein n=1 Tax=Enterococcus faecalis TaxID=1351 RepID=UPI003D6B3AC1